jgi:hypothetical protein
MHIIHITNKGKMTDMEKFYIYRETEAKNQINKLTVQNYAVLETIVYEDPYWGLGCMLCLVMCVEI